MPIFTLCSKSMPSTNSRKPCTKCCRDCSPSLTMSTPASSCSFSQSSVASRFACSSSAPCTRHAGHSFPVSASHAGLGRLPAMVVLNMSGSGDSDEIVTPHYNRPLQKGGSPVFGMLVGTFCSFVMGIFNPYVVNKAGPDWLWGGGRDDLVRNLYFRHDGTFRRYGRLALIATLFGGSAAVFWML